MKSKPKQRQAILRKIAALRAMTAANGAAPAEVDAALRMSTRLMEKHGVTIQELRPFEGGSPSGAGGARLGRKTVLGAVVTLGAVVVGLVFWGEDDTGRQVVESRPGEVVTTVRAVKVERSGGDVAVVVAAQPPDRVAMSEPAAAVAIEPVSRPNDSDLATATVPNVAASSAETVMANMTQARIRVVRYNNDDFASMAMAVAQTFRDAHAEDVTTDSVAFPINQTHVRYFSSQDRDAAVAALALIGRATPDGLEAKVQDFSSFRPTPPPNTIEIWMGSH